LKGKLDRERPPRIIVDGERTRVVDSAKYLGLKIDRNFKFDSHAEDLAKKVTDIYIYQTEKCD